MTLKIELRGICEAIHQLAIMRYRFNPIRLPLTVDYSPISGVIVPGLSSGHAPESPVRARSSASLVENHMPLRVIDRNAVTARTLGKLLIPDTDLERVTHAHPRSRLINQYLSCRSGSSPNHNAKHCEQGYGTIDELPHEIPPLPLVTNLRQGDGARKADRRLNRVGIGVEPEAIPLGRRPRGSTSRKLITVLKRELKAGKGIGPELKEFLLSHANISAEALDDLLRYGSCSS